jgi:hypothetical protein
MLNDYGILFPPPNPEQSAVNSQTIIQFDTPIDAQVQLRNGKIQSKTKSSIFNEKQKCKNNTHTGRPAWSYVKPGIPLSVSFLNGTPILLSLLISYCFN